LSSGHVNVSSSTVFGISSIIPEAKILLQSETGLAAYLSRFRQIHHFEPEYRAGRIVETLARLSIPFVLDSFGGAGILSVSHRICHVLVKPDYPAYSRNPLFNSVSVIFIFYLLFFIWGERGFWGLTPHYVIILVK